jgi:hypothetical protein
MINAQVAQPWKSLRHMGHVHNDVLNGVILLHQYGGSVINCSRECLDLELGPSCSAETPHVIVDQDTPNLLHQHASSTAFFQNYHPFAVPDPTVCALVHMIRRLVLQRARICTQSRLLVFKDSDGNYICCQSTLDVECITIETEISIRASAILV